MIVIEFHRLERQSRHELYLRSMRSLLKYFRLVHTHACNCAGVWKVEHTNYGMPRITEATFVRKDRVLATKCVASEYYHSDSAAAGRHAQKNARMDVPNCKRWAQIDKRGELFADAFKLPPLS